MSGVVLVVAVVVVVVVVVVAVALAFCGRSLSCSRGRVVLGDVGAVLFVGSFFR